MKDYIRLTFLITLLLITNQLDAQKRALGKPESFMRPILKIQNDESINPYAIEEKEKTPWIVICDQDNAQTFKHINKAGNLENPKEQLKFRNWFYVSEETDFHIRIFKGKISPTSFRVRGEVKDYGWIAKKDMLLWTSSLIDETTKIDLKAFLLNKASDIDRIIQLEKKEIVKIYNGAHTKDIVENKTIYEFYFVFKVSGSRYLLSKNVTINPVHNPEDLMGWVEQERLELWNTRICIEPNFEEAAYQERKSNSNFHLIAYGDQESAKLHSEKGIRIDEKAIWINDPVILPPNNLATNKHRFKGGVVRFPMLSNRRGSTYFRSGLIGKLHIENELSLPEPVWASITQLVEGKEVALRQNFDVLFLIEGTKSMAQYKQTIEKAIKKVNQELIGVPNVRYGVGIYRDTPEKKEQKLFDIKKMTSSMDDIISFISKTEFARWHDNDNYTAMYYGLNQAMLEANMNNRHTNLVFIFGNNADLKAERSRNEIDECFVKTETLSKKLADFNTHIIAIQCQNKGREGAFFIKNIRSLMLETANVQYKTYSKISKTVPDIQVVNPELTDENHLKNGANIGMIIASAENTAMLESNIIDKTADAAKKIYEFVDDFWEGLNKLVEDGVSIKDIGPEYFAPPAANILFNIVEEGKKGGITPENLEKITKEKYKLYAEVYIPKKIKGANYDTYSQVLFMPEKDLEHYVEVLEALSSDLMKPEDQLRKGLHQSLTDLVEQYTGHKAIPLGYQTDDLRAIMQGITKEGIKINKNRDFAIENVLNEKKMSIRKVRDFSNDMVAKNKKLKQILKEGKKYEFSYSSKNNTYFWIPIEYTF